jgi:hypothetical protein
MKLVKLQLPDNEYYKEQTQKKVIVLHHTAGSYRPDYTIQGWDLDKNSSGIPIKVGTSYVIGGLSEKNDKTYNGVIYQAFDDIYWAHHLGCKTANNTFLNKQSIGIEICNWGPLTLTKDGKFLNYVKREVPKEMVYELKTPFKGYKFYHKYTPEQIESTRLLLIDLSKKHNIDLKKGLQELFKNNINLGVSLNNNALKGSNGLWTHVNYRSDKFDIHPQPEMIKMILTL